MASRGRNGRVPQPKVTNKLKAKTKTKPNKLLKGSTQKKPKLRQTRLNLQQASGPQSHRLPSPSRGGESVEELPSPKGALADIFGTSPSHFKRDIYSNDSPGQVRELGIMPHLSTSDDSLN